MKTSIFPSPEAETNFTRLYLYIHDNLVAIESMYIIIDHMTFQIINRGLVHH